MTTLSSGVFVLRSRQPSREFGERDLLAVESNQAFGLNTDNALLGCGSERRGRSHFGQFQLDVTLHLGKRSCDHEEDDQQEHNVDHRRQVQRRLFVLLRFERHG